MTPPSRPSSSPSILVVEDDTAVASTICEGLAAKGFTAWAVRTLAAARSQIASQRIDAIVLDISLPDGNGLLFASELRAAGCSIPLVMLTARDSVSDRIVGFERGADDYLGKPFDVAELAARLQAVLRRASGGARHVLRIHDLELDLLTRMARRPNLESRLSDREAELLAFFIRHADEHLSRQRILDEVWKDEVEDDSNIVNVYVNLLRNKIDTPQHVPLIRTVRGIGYMLSAKNGEEPP